MHHMTFKNSTCQIWMRIQINKKIAPLFILLSLFSTLYSQDIPDTIAQKIDSLFAPWNNSTGPGCAVGIVRNDSLIFSKGYGLADLEHEIPITPKTIFYMASVSKQFTGYAIVLLARQGKLNLDEDIHHYIPWAPEFGKKITVRHLLNHTSGIRDDIYLSALSGLGYGGMLTQDLALNIIKRQRSLNFIPGEKYSYSNANFVLLAEIVKAVSGKSFRAFVDSTIFKPLGMVNSRFQDDYTELIPNRAWSYDITDGKQVGNSFQNVYTLGDGGMFTNIIDMAKWVTNFYQPRAGDLNDIDQLTETGKLNNGKKINYALGIAVDHYRGWKEYEHSGGLAGYRTILFVFPDLKMGFLIFSNMGNLNSQEKVHELANLFIPDTTKSNKEDKPEARDSSHAMLKDPLQYTRFTGDYLGEDGDQFSFSISNQKMYASSYGQSTLLLQESKDTFSLFTNPAVKFVFQFSSQKTSLVHLYWPEDNKLMRKYVPDSIQSDKTLQAYTGTYYSPELDCHFSISLKEHHLVLSSNKYADKPLMLIGKDDILDKNGLLSYIKIRRDRMDKIIGFEVNSGIIRHLRFNKVK